MTDIDYKAVIAKLNAERVVRINLEYRENALGLETAWLSWNEDSRTRITREIPKGLNLAAQLAYVDTWQSGHETGVEDGRFKLQGELLDLLGAARDV